jgi:hypothetical protein
MVRHAPRNRFLVPLRAFLCLTRGHGPATSRSGSAKPFDFTRQPRRSAGESENGLGIHSQASPNICCIPAFGGTRVGLKLPSISNLCALVRQPLSRASGKRMSLQVADMHDWQVGSTSWDFSVVVPCWPLRVSH